MLPLPVEIRGGLPTALPEQDAETGQGMPCGERTEGRPACPCSRPLRMLAPGAQAPCGGEAQMQRNRVCHSEGSKPYSLQVPSLRLPTQTSDIRKQGQGVGTGYTVIADGTKPKITLVCKPSFVLLAKSAANEVSSLFQVTLALTPTGVFYCI